MILLHHRRALRQLMVAKYIVGEARFDLYSFNIVLVQPLPSASVQRTR